MVPRHTSKTRPNKSYITIRKRSRRLQYQHYITTIITITTNQLKIQPLYSTIPNTNIDITDPNSLDTLKSCINDITQLRHHKFDQ